MPSSKPISATPPSLVGSKLYLRPATAEDIANTFHWSTINDPQMCSFDQSHCMSAKEASEKYKSESGNDTYRTFVITTIKGKNAVGLITYSDINNLNRSARVSFLIDPEEKRGDHGIEALRIICKYLFKFRNLNRAYTFVSALLEDDIRQLKKAGFTDEGTLKQHHFYDGQFHDVKIMAIMAFEFH